MIVQPVHENVYVCIYIYIYIYIHIYIYIYERHSWGGADVQTELSSTIMRIQLFCLLGFKPYIHIYIYIYIYITK